MEVCGISQTLNSLTIYRVVQNVAHSMLADDSTACAAGAVNLTLLAFNNIYRLDSFS